jgi:hypothetical protein
MVDGTCQYAADNREFEGEPERVVVVDDGYTHAPIALVAGRVAGPLRWIGMLTRIVAEVGADAAEEASSCDGRTFVIPFG